MTQYAFGSGTLIGKRTDVANAPPALLATCESFKPSWNFSRSTSRMRRISVLVLGIPRSRNEKERTIPAVTCRPAETQSQDRAPDYTVMRCRFAP